MEGLNKEQSLTEEEKRARAAEKVIAFLKKTDAVKEVDQIIEGDSAISFDQFKNALVHINGIARDIPKVKRGAEERRVEIVGFVDRVNVPDNKDKEPLLKYAFDAASRIPKEDLKYMLPAVVNAVHLFENGNGRTSRTLHLLLRHHKSEADAFDAIRTAMGEDGRWNSFDINPGKINDDLRNVVIARHGWNFDEGGQPVGVGSIEAPISVVDREVVDKESPAGKRTREFLYLYDVDVLLGLTAIREALGDDRVRSLSIEVNGQKSISPLKLQDELSEDEWNSVFQHFYALKREQVEDLVNSFVDPKEYLTEDGSQTIRDYFVGRIENDTSDLEG